MTISQEIRNEVWELYLLGVRPSIIWKKLKMSNQSYYNIVKECEKLEYEIENEENERNNIIIEENYNIDFPSK